MEPVSLYVHIPFCIHRCGYCDFNTFAGLESLIPDYTDALCDEIDFLGSYAHERRLLHSIYFGGGTPSLLSGEELQSILSKIHGSFDFTPEIEITLEANPGTVSLDYLMNLAGLGVNRISIGMQSARQDELNMLERQHTLEDVENVVKWSRLAGIKNLNLDLIYGLPNQEVNTWMSSVEAALNFNPEHLSLYALTLEHGTPMFQMIKSARLPELDQDLAADMYEAASKRLDQAGFVQYEISNWARMGHGNDLYSCRHNLQYWHNDPYIGLGAGAHGYIHHYRTINARSPRDYINRLKKASQDGAGDLHFPRTPATVQLHAIDRQAEIGETMMMGLRLTREGVSDQEFRRRFGASLRQIFTPQIDRFIKLNLLEWAGAGKDRLRLTSSGRLLGNQVFSEFI